MQLQNSCFFQHGYETLLSDFNKRSNWIIAHILNEMFLTLGPIQAVDLFLQIPVSLLNAVCDTIVPD